MWIAYQHTDIMFVFLSFLYYRRVTITISEEHHHTTIVMSSQAILLDIVGNESWRIIDAKRQFKVVNDRHLIILWQSRLIVGMQNYQIRPVSRSEITYEIFWLEI